jgi:hypothetical protein
VFAASSAAANATFFFGSKLDSTVQPSNAESAHPCGHPARACTWVMNQAYGRPNGGHKSPHPGTITKIRLIAGDAGSFRLQIVRARETDTGFEAKVVRNGPKISYLGQPDPNEPYKVEVFRVHVPVSKGDRLAIKAKKTSTLRCSSGGPNTLLFDPPLVVGTGFHDNFDEDGCWMLIEAVVQPS